MILNKLTSKILLTVLAVCSLSACTKDFDTINKDPYGVSDEELERDGYNIGASLIGLQSFVIPTKEHLNQFHEVLAGGSFSGYTAVTPEWTAKFSTYNPPQDWIKAPFNDVIAGIYPYYEQMHAVTKDPVALALAKLLRVASMHRLTDTFGPIPYSKMSAAGGSEGGSSLTAPYDSQETVYKQMIKELDEVIVVLTENKLADPSKYRNYDKVYGGDVINWIKYANSLKLRMAIRMAYVAPALAKETAESAVANSIGVITSNNENALLKVNTNPFELQVVQWGDDRAGADIVSYMNGYKDPRREKYFKESTFTSSTVTNGYYGLRSGIDVASKATAMQYSMPLVKVSDPIMWMNAAEVSFLRAEGALRGWAMNGTAQNLYNAGIALSFSQVGASGADAYINNSTDNPESYRDPLNTYTYNGATSTIKIKWDESAGFEANLERIITQKWIANFPLGIESWSEYRRTGYPRLMPVVQNKSGGTINTAKMIRRLPYPDTEYNENFDNLYNAIKLLGGPDNGGTNLWWDVKR